MTGLRDHRNERVSRGPPHRRSVAILPGSGLGRYRELWRALEEAYPVSFVSGDDDLEHADAVIALPGGPGSGRRERPCLVLQTPAGSGERSTFTVAMSRSVGLDRALHGQRLREEHGHLPAPVPAGSGWRVLATAEGRPIWSQSDQAHGEREIASAVPPDLGDDEYLRDHLTAGRFWSLLPVVHFLKRITGGLFQGPRPLQACFVIDDPNVRFSSYGHVKFPELARDAREYGYHVAVATIPLDLVVPGRRAVSVFREHRRELSLAVHGNNHVRRELERPRSACSADRLVRSAVTRVARFEQRAGIRVDRVMCPPHGACGAQTLGALLRFGFLGLAASRPFPWDEFAGQRRWRLGGWLPAQLVAGGLPVVSRYSLTRSLDDLVFRAFLGQPLILYCHHADIGDGLDPFRTAVERVAQLGHVRWRSLASITRENALFSEWGGMPTVTLYSRDLRVARPRESAVRIEVPRIFDGPDELNLVVDGTTYDVPVGDDGRFSLAVAAHPGVDAFRVRIPARAGVAHPAGVAWVPGPWPLVRRALTESRDRALPLLRAVRP